MSNDRLHHPLYFKPTSNATSDTDGLVKTNTDDPAGDPVVYRKSEVDTAIAAATPGIATAAARGLVKVHTDDPGNDPIVYRVSEVDALIAAITGSTPPPVFTVTVSPAGAGVVVGYTQQLTVVLKSLFGQILTGRTVAWTTSDATKATVDSTSGLVTGVAAGTCTITCTSEGKTGTCSITVIASSVPLWYKVARDTFASVSGSITSDAGTYWDKNGVVRTASANTARESHYVNGKKTLLAEPAFENGVTQSGDITNAAWTKSSCSTSGAVVGPDNVASSAKGVKPISGATTLTDGTLHVSQNVTSNISIRHALMWHIAPGSKQFGLLQYKNRSGAFFNCWFDFVNGTVKTQSSTVGKIWQLANGNFCIQMICTAQDTGASQAVMAFGFVDADSSKVCTSDGNAIAGYMWGAQSNKNGFPGSYVATTSAAVSRNADQVKVPYSMVPANRTFYFKYTDWFSNQNVLDTTNGCVASVDGTTSQGTHAHQFYISNAQKHIFFSSAFTSGNASITGSVGVLATAPGDTVEIRAVTQVGSNMQLGYALNMGVESVQTPAADGGTYSAAFGAGSTYVFLGELAGGSRYLPMCFEEVKIINSTVSTLVDIRGQGVSQAPVGSITLSPTTANIVQGDIRNFTAVVKDINGVIVTDRIVTWDTADSGVATVDSYGNVTAVGSLNATTTVSASCEGYTAIATVKIPNFV